MSYLKTLLFSLFLLASPFASASSDSDEITRMLHEFMAGASANDREAHDRFWSEGLVYTSSSGTRFGKAEIMSGFDDPDDESEEGPATVYTAEEVRVQQYADTAVVSFRLVGTTDESPPVVTQYFNTGTFLRPDDQWQVVAWQATRIPEAE
jgi:hypothetical protein